MLWSIALIVSNMLVTQVSHTYQLAWSNIYDFTGSAKVNDLAIDDSENIYLTGSIYSAKNWDYLLIKCDSSGDTMWSSIYDHGGDYGASVALDQYGNAHIGGFSFIDQEKYVVVKYTSIGSISWVAVDNDASSDEEGHGVAVDNNGNSFITGYIFDDRTSIVSVKYDLSGNLVWRKVYDTGTYEYAWGACTDQDNSLYVVGGIRTDNNGDDALIIKYSSNGNLIWSKTLDINGNDERAFDIAVDSNKNVYITGYTDDTINNYFTAKFDSSGTLIWSHTLTGGRGNGIVVDDSGYVYVTSSYLTIKYDTSGNIVWMDSVGGTAIGVAPSGNIYIATTASDNIVLYKYIPVNSSVGHSLHNEGYFLEATPLKNVGILIKYNLPYATKFHLTISDIQGRLLKQVTRESNGNRNLYIYNTRKRGVYIIKLYVNNRILATQRVIIY